MPLHLLGKKSWNVYNQDNIERVRQDEARARAAEQEAERRTKEDDASDRLRILRDGQIEDEESEPVARPDNKRKRDEDHDPLHRHREDKQPKYPRRHEVPRDKSKDEGVSEANTTQDSLDQISNMRFRDAAGHHPDARQPWYSNATPTETRAEVGRNVWGKEDAGRQARDQKRLNASDPLLAIKRGVKQLKDVERQKSEWRTEREKDLYEVEELARRERHRRHKEERLKREKDRHRSRRSDDRKRHHSDEVDVKPRRDERE